MLKAGTRRRSSRRHRRTGTSKKSATWLSAQQRLRLRQEAQSLGMTPNEYMRLLLSLSATLRESFPFDSDMNAKQLLELVDHPLFAVLLKYLGQSAISSFTSSDEKDAKAADRPSGEQERPRAVVQRPDPWTIPTPRTPPPPQAPPRPFYEPAVPPWSTW